MSARRRKKKSKAGLGLLLALLAAAGGVGGWYFSLPPARQAAVRERLAVLWRDFQALIARPDSPEAALAGITPQRPDIPREEAEAAGEKARAAYKEIESVKQVPGIDARRLASVARVRLEAGETEFAGERWPMAHAYYEASREASEKISKTDRASVDAYNRRNAAQSLREQLMRMPHPKLDAARLEAAQELLDAADLAFESANFPDAAKAYLEASLAYGELKAVSDQLFRYDEVRRDFAAALGQTNQELLARYGGDAWKEIQGLQAQGDALDANAPGQSLAALEMALKRLPEAVRLARKARARELFTLAMREADEAAARGDHAAAIEAARRAMNSGHDTLQPALTRLAEALAAAGRPSGEIVSLALDDTRNLDLVFITPGVFRMGLAGGDADEVPVREVRVERPFFLARTETTVGQWTAVMPSHPGGKSVPDAPAASIQWREANEYAARLSSMFGLRLRLPTEVEWEYACRAGTDTRFSFGDAEDALAGHGNFCDAACATRTPGESRRDGHAGVAPAMSFKPNPWGLYDMHGNVMEWCADRYNPGAYAGAPEPGDAEGAFRSLRGGSYNFPAPLCASGRRYRGLEGVTNDYIGFRLLLELR